MRMKAFRVFNFTETLITNKLIDGARGIIMDTCISEILGPDTINLKRFNHICRQIIASSISVA